MVRTDERNGKRVRRNGRRADCGKLDLHYILFVIVKLLSWLLGKIGTGLVNKSKALSTVNRVLGAILGLVKGIFLIFLILTICYWLPIDGLHTYIGESSVVGAIFDWEWFRWAAEFRFLK